MKNLCTLLLSLILITSAVCAQQQTQDAKNRFPQGVFKKQRNGQVVQYDNNGKKIGIYKIKNGKYVKVK